MKEKTRRNLPKRIALLPILSALFTLTCMTSALAEEVTFADPILETVVRSALPSSVGESLTAEDLRGLEVLHAARLGITRLDGLEHATALNYLDLSFNQIEDLSPLSELTQLTHLDLGCGMPMNGDDDVLRFTPTNKITNLDALKSLDQLAYLNLTGNEALRDISVLSALSALRILWLGHCEIDDYEPLRALDSLRTLGIFDGALENEDLKLIAQLTKLESLCLYENPAVSDLSPLEQLNLSRADFDTLSLNDLAPIGGWTNLEWLNISSSNLHDIAPLASLEALVVLRLDDNNIEDISALRSLKHLRELDLGENRIRVLDALAGLEALELLILDHNEIERVSPLASLDALETLDIEFNHAVDFDEIIALPALQELVANHNAFEDLSAARTNIAFGSLRSHVLEIAHNPWNENARCAILPELIERFNASGATLKYDLGCGTIHRLTIKRVGKGEVYPEPGQYWFYEGSNIIIDAFPISDSAFAWSRFEGDGETELGKRYIAMNGDREVTVVFVEEGHVLDIRTVGSPFGRTYPDEGSYRYADGVEVQVMLNPEHSDFFAGWRGAAEGWGKSVAITMDSDKEIIAEFQHTGYDLTFSYSGYGSTEPAPGIYSIAADAVLTLDATSVHPQWPFIGWEGDLDADMKKDASSIEILMDRPRVVNAVFDARFSLEIDVVGEGTTIPEAGKHMVQPEESTELSAIPPEDMSYLFHHWEGDLRGADPNQPTISLLNHLETKITAVFSPARAVHLAITGEGTTVPKPGTHHYFQDADVELKALPIKDWAFEHWVGDAFPEPRTETTVTLGPGVGQNVTASFSPADYNLTLKHKGSGTGNTYPPEGVYGYKHGQSVTIEASRHEGTYFQRWHGDIGTQSAFTSSLTVDMSSAREITAEFVVERSFSIKVRGTGGTTNPVPGVYLGKDGSDVFAKAIVEDEETVEFSHWEINVGKSRSKELQLDLELTSDIEVTAVFVPKQDSEDSAEGSVNPAD